jgi:phage shock protein E
MNQPVIIDVRSKLEFKMGHAKNAINIPLGSIQDSPKLADIAKDTPILVYCASGTRSGMAAQILQSQGYTNVKNAINKDGVSRYL